MNLSEMTDQVSDELRNVNIADKIARWLNMAIIDIASTYVFNELHAYGSVPSGVGDPNIPLAADYLWLKTIQVPARQQKLYPEDEQRLAEVSPDYRTLQGSVTHYYFTGTRNLGLYKVPDVAETVTYSYQKRPTKLVLAADITELAAQWHAFICQKAVTYGCNYDSNDSAAAKSMAKERSLLLALGSMVYRRTDATQVLGGEPTRRKPARPRLPSNYPQPRS